MKTCFLLSLVFTASLGFAQVPYAGNDADNGVTRANRAEGLIDPYTGNIAFGTHDLAVSGAVGSLGLSWKRFATSRPAQTGPLFGLGHNWAHSWQWEMVAAGRDEQGRAVLSVREPQGWVHRFTETSPGSWTPAPSVRDRVVSAGDDFTVQRLDAGEVRFVRSRTAQGDVFTLREWVDGQGNVWNFAWEDGLLVRVTEPAGRWLKISHEALTAPGAAREAKPYTVISRVAASDGQVVAYEYDFPAGMDYPVLTGVAYPDATHASYVYAAPRPGDRLLLAQADDPRADRAVRGRAFRYRTEAEAAFGQALEIRAANGGEVMQSFAADPAGPRSYAVRQDNGGTAYRTYNAGGNLAEDVDELGFAKKHDYDAGGRGFRTATTDALGRVTRFENDASGHVVKTTFPDGSVKTWQRDARGRVLAETDELGQTRRYTRDAQGRVTRVQHPDGSSDETTYNGFGQMLTRKDRGGAVMTMTYDVRGLRTRTTNALGATTAFAYDAQDRLAATTDARGNTTRYERDAAGRVTKTIYADGTSTSAVYDAFGQLIQNTDAAGAVRRMTYDSLGRLVATVDALGRETRTEYAPVGKTAPLNRPVRTITASGRATAMTYDAAGRVTARTAAAGTKEAATTRTAYDAAGRQISATNPLGKSVQFFHDERGRRTKTMSALNHAKTTTYDAAGRRLSETDAKGNTTRWTYDAMGRELTKTDAKGQVTRREYNAAGRLVALIDAKLNTYRFEYDLLGRQTALVYPDGSRETTAYDAAGLKVSTTNRAGTVRTFAYDNRNREIGSEWSDGSQKIVKAYDAAGRMTLEDNGVSKLTFAYDEIGRLASETQDLSPMVTDGASDPVARTVSYTYNADGQRETLGYPDGSFVKFAYNARGQLAEILGDGVPPPIASYEYDSAGNATRMPRENATETEREFDAENKTLAITDRAAGRRSPLSELEYLYDEAGNRTATLAAVDADDRGAKEETLDAYRYDDTYQVIGADYAAPVNGNSVGSPVLKEKFTYDAVGNRIEVGRVVPNAPPVVTRYTVNNLNQYIQVGEFAPTHDRKGNLSGMGQWLYLYDAMNRLVSTSNGQMMAKFFYDAKNRCVARSYQSTGSALAAPSSTLTLNTYDNWNLIEERDASGAQVARYVHGRKIDEIIVMVNPHGAFYPHHDVLGNVTMLTDRFGRLVERYTYSVTGQVAISDATGKTLTDSAVGNRWMFTGREWLQEVGLYDYRNRVYSAELGRFLQTDPIRFSTGDINVYRYVENRLLFYTDPNGEDWVRPATEPYVAGREGTIVEPGGLASVIIEDFVPAGHTFAQNHDAFVDWAVNEAGIPDEFANVPTMPFVYIVSFVEEIFNSIFSLWNWLTE
ncbi:MAG: RHS repeat-associated core domain-containing protein [Verrucomicrobiota bacterium]